MSEALAQNTKKSPTALRTIGEVAEELGIAPHVLRFWESKFTQIKPQKRRGRRYYRPEDIKTITQIKALLYGQGYTIRGVQKFFAEGRHKVEEQAQHISLATPSTAVDNRPRDLFGNLIVEEDEHLEQSPSHGFTQEQLEQLQQFSQNLSHISQKLKKIS